jgi:hypothetical protein
MDNRWQAHNRSVARNTVAGTHLAANRAAIAARPILFTLPSASSGLSKEVAAVLAALPLLHRHCCKKCHSAAAAAPAVSAYATPARADAAVSDSSS